MSSDAVTPLRHRMIEDMNARKLSAGTQRGHIHSCKRFAAFLNRSPDTATTEDIRRFQLHLAEAGVSICNRNRIMTAWLQQVRHGLGLRQASVTGLWAALTSGARGGAVQPTGAGGDRALFRLIELHAYFRELGRPERRLLLALRVAAGEAAPADDRELAELKSALRAVLALQRSGRGPRRRPPGLRGIVMTRPGSG